MAEINYYRYVTVSDSEVSHMMSSIKFQNLFRLLNLLYNDALNIGVLFPSQWLITSIDRYAKDGNLRYPVERGNHYDSHAVDIVPLENPNSIRLPITLNRLCLLHDYFISGFKSFNKSEMPLIAFESDHIHSDINGPPGIYRLKDTRPYFDTLVYNILKLNPQSFLAKALNSKELIKLY